MWDREARQRRAVQQDARGNESDPPLNRVTRPAGDNDIYARQVYDVWSATHELRVEP